MTVSSAFSNEFRINIYLSHALANYMLCPFKNAGNDPAGLFNLLKLKRSFHYPELTDDGRDVHKFIEADYSLEPLENRNRYNVQFHAPRAFQYPLLQEDRSYIFVFLYRRYVKRRLRIYPLKAPLHKKKR